MKCNVCGQEFGNGAYCQHCNADRITALGNYSGGYNAPDVPKNVTSNTSAGGTNPTSGYGSGNDLRNSSKQNVSGNGREQFMVCYKCANVIPVDSEYCPCCRTKLYEVCPKCGHRYSSQYKICNKCGTNKEEYIEEQREIERQQREEARQRQEAARKEEEAKLVAAATAKVEQLKKTALTITAKAGAAGKLFGSINNHNLSEELSKLGIDIDRKYIKIPGNTIKRTGKFSAIIRLHRNVEYNYEFDVISDAPVEAPAPKETAKPAAAAEETQTEEA